MNAILADNLRAHMERRGWSMARLSREAGANATAVFDVLHQRTRSPKLETVERLADALGTTVLELLQDGSREEAEQALLRAFVQLSPGDRQRLIAVARAWTGLEDTH